MRKFNKSLLIEPQAHLMCDEYLVSRTSGFVQHKINKGEQYHVKNNNQNRLFFLLEGNAEVHYGIGDDLYKQVHDFPIRQKQFFFLPKSADLKIVAQADMHFIENIFDQLISLCDKMALKSLPIGSNNIILDICRLEIRHPLHAFLNLLLRYLDSGLLCGHIHKLKQQELFLLLRSYYSKQDNAALFAPIIGQNLSFKIAVQQNCFKVKSINELARSCNCSLATFRRLFFKNFNTTPSQWLLEQKLQQISQKLANEDISFSQIVDEYHFTDASHFCAFCKQHFNLTPLQFRRHAIRLIKVQVNTEFNGGDQVA